MKFYVPSTLAADFDDFLNTDVPNQVGNFELLPNWYAQFEDGYEPVIIRGEIYPDSTKSRYENTDNNMNFRASVSSGIKKGDMLIEQSTGTVYVLDWEVALETNNAPSRALRCNTNLTIKRFMPEQTDEYGYLIAPEGEQVVVDHIPCNAFRYDGRPEYVSISGTPGISPNALTIITMQYNDITDNIRLDDKFVWGHESYRIIDIDLFGLSRYGTSGTLRLQAKKEAGGAVE